MRMMKKILWLNVAMALLLGCASEPPVQPPPPPTVVNLEIIPAPTANPDVNGNGSPLMLRSYELTVPSNFESADFFAIFNNDQAVLAEQLVRKHQVLLQPGVNKNMTFTLDDNVASLGFFAALRQIDNASWRASVKIKPHQTQFVKISIDQNQMTLEAQP